jgi:dolichol-phosphate mannosyltransferase
MDNFIMQNYCEKMLSIVVPVYYGEKSLRELHRRIKKSVEAIFPSYELILVNDASPDNSWEIIRDLCKQDTNVKGINLSRNFGQHYAITAGLNYIRGEWIVVMDCDLQDVPEEIIHLYNETKKGYDIVFAKRVIRKDSFFKRLFSKVFYWIFSYLTDTVQNPSVANFGMYHHKVITAILSMKDHIRYFPAMAQWIGFKKNYVQVKHDSRFDGKSSYTIKKLLSLAADNVFAFSDKPLRIITYLGFFISMFAFFLSVYFFILHLLRRIEILGFVSIILSIWLLGGIVIFILGVTGIYICKIFDRVKERPLFIISNTLNIQ